MLFNIPFILTIVINIIVIIIWKLSPIPLHQQHYLPLPLSSQLSL
jgi:hypothetical protein